MTTPYFAFCKEIRPKVTEELGSKSITIVAKELGKRWKALSDDEKTRYKEISIEAKKAAGQTSTSTKKRKSDLQLPFQKVKRIAMLSKDEEVKAIAKASVILISKATELFLQSLGKSCIKIAKGTLIKDETLMKTIHFGNSRLHFLRHDFQTPDELKKSK